MISKVKLDKLKLRPRICQTGTFIYKSSKVIAKYFSPLAKDEYTIVLELLKHAPFDENYEYVSYDVESFFTCAPVQDTVDNILHKIYHKKGIKPFCKKFILKKLLIKLIKEPVFSVNSS